MPEDGTVPFNCQGMPLSPVVRQTEVVGDLGHETSLTGMRLDCNNGTPVGSIDLHKLYVWRIFCHTATLPTNHKAAHWHRLRPNGWTILSLDLTATGSASTVAPCRVSDTWTACPDRLMTFDDENSVDRSRTRSRRSPTPLLTEPSTIHRTIARTKPARRSANPALYCCRASRQFGRFRHPS